MAEAGLRKPPPEGDHEPPPKPKRFWWRFTLGSLVIVIACASAVGASGILFADSIAHAISENISEKEKKKLDRELANVDGGGPENILILGSDKRASMGEERGRSDTTMLIRLNPDRNLISVLSIPRDLKVDIPGVGIEKFNAAYTYGGPSLTLRVIKELTGLQVNHEVNVDFLGFVRAVDAIGCVYTDVDRRYYHSNVGVPPAEQYSEINIKPGYQLLCGKKALEYVRYRHTDTDIVRSARQQDFLSQARQEIPLSDLLTGQGKLLEIFTEYTSSDISDAATLIRVIDLLVESRNATVDQVHFPAELGPSFVYASESAIHHAVREFMGEIGPDASSSTEGSSAGGGHSSHRKGGGKHSKSHHKPVVKYSPGGDGLVPAAEAGEQEAKDVARKEGSGFPVYYLTRMPAGASYVENDSYEHIQNPRTYHLKDTDDNRRGAYRMVATYQPEYEINYFGVQGIQGWADPPILNDPSETRTIHGREYEIFVDGGQVKLIAWHRGNNTYWISNSLQQSLTNDQMVGMARSAKVIVSHHKRHGKGRSDERA